MKKCPCENCISYAICINQKKISCRVLYDHLTKYNKVSIPNCYTLSLYKARVYFLYGRTHQIEFVRNYKEAMGLILENYSTSISKFKRIVRWIRFHLVTLIIKSVSTYRILKNRYKELRQNGCTM
jgi:hypothetical protein